MNDPSFEDMGFGLYPVTTVQHCMKELKDGTKIAMKVFLPCKKEELYTKFPCFVADEILIDEVFDIECKSLETKFPVVLEYLPYAKDSSMTLWRDYAHHPWLASHGYVVIRIDLRGSGASSGFYFDEYDQQEFDDGVEIIDWIESEPWSNGNVGMYGKSWGGFNGLQLAYKQPRALKGIISLYSSDDRYNNDVHYQNGALMANGMVSWANFMFSINARPLPPAYFKNTNEWRDAYKERLETAGQSFLATWLHHQDGSDPYWLHGSIKTDYSKVLCPILAIAGHADLYKDSAFRMACELNEESRVIFGPWAHQWPDLSVVGPKIDFLKVCLNWWDCHLKNVPDRSAKSWPRVQLYLLDSMKPCEISSDNPGVWVNIPHWKSKMAPRVKNDIFYHLHNDFSLKTEEDISMSEEVELPPHVMQGSSAGASFSIDSGFIGDQNEANNSSVCWVTEPLQKDVIIVGMPEFKIAYSTKKDGQYYIQVRVCDQLPSGESMLVTKGGQKLSTSSKGWVGESKRDVKNPIKFNLSFCAKIIRAGHRLVVALSPTNWPTIFPTLDVKGLCIYPTECQFSFKTLTLEELSNISVFDKPRALLNYPVEIEQSGMYRSENAREGDLYTHIQEERSDLLRYPRLRYSYEDNYKEKYITDEEVSFGCIEGESMSLSKFVVNNENIKVEVKTKQVLKGERNYFNVTEELNVKINDEDFFKKCWDNVIPRKYV